jgi:hypothetical protein
MVTMTRTNRADERGTARTRRGACELSDSQPGAVTKAREMATTRPGKPIEAERAKQRASAMAETKLS